MSSDRKEPGATWQGPTNASSTWGQASEQVPASGSEEVLPHSEQQRIDASNASTPLPTEPAAQPGTTIRGNIHSFATSPSTLEVLKYIGHFALLIFVPILFGVITGLLVLPSVAAGQASAPPLAFFPILLILIAITIAQGVAIYYAGTDNGLWIPGTLAAFSLFLLVGCFSLFGLVPGLLLLLALIVVAVLLVRRCMHPVPDGYVDIVYAFKKYRRTLYSGLNILFPWEIIYTQLNTEEVQWLCPTQVIQLSREEDVILQAVISYQLIPEDAHLAIKQIRNWEESLRTLFQTLLQTIATVFSPNDFLTWPQGIHGQPGTTEDADDFTSGFERREAINNYLLSLVRDRVALWGVQINWVSLRDIELAPHGALARDIRSIAPPPIQAVVAEQPAVLDQPIPQFQSVPTSSAQQVESNDTTEEQPTINNAGPLAPNTFPVNHLKEEVLIKAYREVQDGKITDPETIRGIASKFEAVARDPVSSQSVNFDAARAALNLFERARQCEEEDFAHGD
ncbi:MAG TPA: SPFH domain-containing protein [Dictyobacter sp.]|jgi:hypothetical protein|nr:SPFH domain-containing protein [Dictyobacter sp.]